MCMYCSNYVEYWTIALAAWSCGGCIMPTNCELDPRQLEDQGGRALKLFKDRIEKTIGLLRFALVNEHFEFDCLTSQLIEAEAKVLVCDDFNFEDALGILRGNSVAGLKHLIVVGSEGKSQGCIPARRVIPSVNFMKAYCICSIWRSEIEFQ